MALSYGWRLWYCHNIWVWNEETTRPELCHTRPQLCDAKLQKLKKLNRERIETTSNRRCCPIFQWPKPPEGIIKINMDATIFKKTDHFGVGVVVGDHEGRVMGFVVKYIQAVIEARLAKALAVK